MLLILGLALSFGLFVRSYIIRHWGYRRTEDIPKYWQKVLVAIVTAMAYGVIPSLLIGGCLAWEITNKNLIESRFGHVLASAFYYALYITLTRAATRVVLAPWNGRWRLFNISDARAERVFRAMTLSIILWGICAYLLHIARYFEPTDALMLLLAVGFDAVKAFVIILIAASVFGEIKTKKDIEDEELSETRKKKAGVEADNEGMSAGMRVVLFSIIFALATFSVSLFGYPDLASFIFNRFFATLFLIGMFVIVRKMISDILSRSIIFWVRTFKLRKKLLSKIDFLMSLLITPILVLCLAYMLLRLWGVPASFMTYGIKKFIFGFKVGGIKISLIAIITGLLVFVVSITLVRMFKRRLSENLLTRINMDEGIKHSLVSGFSFIGIIISVVLAISAMGVDLSNLAVIAGALSVGIGFGLQDIIKNLVSGIIILFERPFKVGDWVILGGEEGKIKQINIRSTELETWTKRSVIIPNATLISSSLINLTHGNNWQRQSIIVGVSYDADIDKVTALLIECAKSNKRVARVPAPMVLFKDFGASSLDFELRYHVTDVRTDYVASSEIRYAILKRFREEGIEIAYPQIDVHMKEQ
ncbi:MAG: mechanosensitive ion channel family protein [Alphaproteobacteria bacterium]|nr:mechanosensitive ion channel family protein [Alphaproteobacteria bacterium]